MITLADLAQLTSTTFSGNPLTKIERVSSIQSSDKNSICFVLSDHFLKQAKESQAGVIIVKPGFDHNLDRPLLISEKPELTFTRIIHLLMDTEQVATIHKSALIDSSVLLNNTHSIAAHVVIENNVVLGDKVHIGAGCIIEHDVVIEEGTYLHPKVVVCHGSRIGKNCILHPGVVIGSDGFGLTKDGDEWVKIPQVGRAIIKDNVEIGANTTVDRGALDDTIIHNGVKLDNQIQIAHNVEIGENTAMAACVGVAGSAKIGKNCQISGAAVVLGHLEVTDNVIVTAMSLVTKSIKEPGVYSSGTPLLDNKQWHKNNVRYKQLDGLAKSIKNLEKKL